MRTPLRELILQPSALTNPGKEASLGLSPSPSLCKLGPQEDHDHFSALDFVSAENVDFPSEPFSHPSEWQEICRHLADEQNLSLFPQASSTTSKMTEEALYNNMIETMVLLPPTVGCQQDILHAAHLDTMTKINSISLDEHLRPGDLLEKGVAPSMEDNFSEVISAVAEKPAFPNPPSQVLGYPPSLYLEQLYCSKESPITSGADAEPEDLVPSEKDAFLPSSMLWLSTSTALAADFPSSPVAPGESTVEHRVIEEREMKFPMLLEGTHMGNEAFVSTVETIPCTQLPPQPGDRESRVAQGPTLEDASSSLISDTESWLSPVAWLDKGVNTSFMLENLRQSMSLSFPSIRDIAVGTTPISTCSVGTWFTPPTQGKSSDADQTDVIVTKDSTSETEHFLWSHPLDLTTLSRRDLEDNLRNSYVILEVLSRQLQEWKSQLTAPRPEVQDSSTQTDTSAIGKPWVQVSKELISLLHLSLLHLEEDKAIMSPESPYAENLVSCSNVLRKLRGRLQSLKTEQEEAKHLEKPVPKGRDSAETVLEAFCAQTSQLKQNLASSLLKKTQTQLVELHIEQEQLAQQTTSLTSVLQQDWISMQLDYVTWTALLSRSRELTEKLMAKSRQTLQERDTAIEEKQKVSRELEQVSAHLEDCKGQIEQLKLENSRLATDLQTHLQTLSITESQLQELCNQHAHCTEDLAMKDEMLRQLTQSSEEQASQWQKEEKELKHIQAELQQQQAVLAKEVHDLKETLEFADQENQVAHIELGQVECQLKTTLEVLRERSLQCEDLKDTVENLKAQLTSTIAENQEQYLKKTSQHSQELGLLTEQLRNLTVFLQTKLQEKSEPETVLINMGSIPTLEHSLPNDSTILGSSLITTTDEVPESAPIPVPSLGSDKSAFTRVTPVASLQPTETPDLEKRMAELSASTVVLESLCFQLQESKEEAIRTLQQEICDLQTRLKTQEEKHQEAQKAKETNIEKLNQALCLRYENEKELQEVIQQQNEKILEQIDKSGELISLRGEVMQLTRSLRRAETEAKVLQETLEGQMDPSCLPMATSWIQEKVWLSQEVDKLREMFLEMKNEKAELMIKFQSHRNILEENLRRSDKELKKLDDIVQHIYETLLSVPEVVNGCKELQGLLEFLS